MILTLTSMGETEVKYPATFHVGFAQQSEERVNEISRRLHCQGRFTFPPVTVRPSR
jgi:lactoylglutathione lyase